ncbi:MAG: phage tail protein [Bryobacterales bacterium]|nr:phage tail protein [Bryobacterales bacterium]
MADQFVGEIRIFGFNFPPKGWATCDGQLLPISQNTALFSLLGTQYGGDGKSTFALPNLQGSSPINQGQGPGLSERYVGETGGVSNVTLIQSELPGHSHTAAALTDPGDLKDPTNRVLARSAGGNAYAAAGALVTFNPQTLGITGSGQPHNNTQPYLTMLFCIAMQGIFPQRP